MKKLLVAILCLSAAFACVSEVKHLSKDEDFSFKLCAEKDDDEERYGGPNEGFYLFYKTIVPFIK